MNIFIWFRVLCIIAQALHSRAIIFFVDYTRVYSPISPHFHKIFFMFAFAWRSHAGRLFFPFHPNPNKKGNTVESKNTFFLLPPQTCNNDVLSSDLW